MARMGADAEGFNPRMWVMREDAAVRGCSLGGQIACAARRHGHEGRLYPLRDRTDGRGLPQAGARIEEEGARGMPASIPRGEGTPPTACGESEWAIRDETHSSHQLNLFTRLIRNKGGCGVSAANRGALAHETLSTQ